MSKNRNEWTLCLRSVSRRKLKRGRLLHSQRPSGVAQSIAQAKAAYIRNNSRERTYIADKTFALTTGENHHRDDKYKQFPDKEIEMRMCNFYKAINQLYGQLEPEALCHIARFDGYLFFTQFNTQLSLFKTYINVERNQVITECVRENLRGCSR